MTGYMISNLICICLLSSSSGNSFLVISWWATGTTVWRREMASHCYWQWWRDHLVPTHDRINLTLSYWESIFNRISSSGPCRPNPFRWTGLTAVRRGKSGSIWKFLRERQYNTRQRWWYPDIFCNNSGGRIDFPLLRGEMQLFLASNPL